jgi:hypothetical protein
MDEDPIPFERPIQAIKAVSEELKIPRDTIRKALLRGDLGDCAYQSGNTWLIDTSCLHFKDWFLGYRYQKRRRWARRQFGCLR